MSQIKDYMTELGIGVGEPRIYVGVKPSKWIGLDYFLFYDSQLVGRWHSSELGFDSEYNLIRAVELALRYPGCSAGIVIDDVDITIGAYKGYYLHSGTLEPELKQKLDALLYPASEVLNMESVWT